MGNVKSYYFTKVMRCCIISYLVAVAMGTLRVEIKSTLDL